MKTIGLYGKSLEKKSIELSIGLLVYILSEAGCSLREEVTTLAEAKKNIFGRVKSPAVVKKNYLVFSPENKEIGRLFDSDNFLIHYLVNLGMFETTVTPYLDTREISEELLGLLEIKREVIKNPEPIVTYPSESDPRDGVPQKGTRMFLSRAREIARGCPECEWLLSDPTGEIWWEKGEWCPDCHLGDTSKVCLTKEEAEKSPESGCYCGNSYGKVSSFTLVYGEKKYT